MITTALSDIPVKVKRNVKANKANTSPILGQLFMSLQQRYDDQQRRKIIKPKPKWKPTQRIGTLVLVELLRAGRPLRQKELKQRCQRRMSPASFKAALKILVKQNKIRRQVHSRKNVSYDANLDDKTVTAFQNLLAKIRPLTSMRGVQSWKDLDDTAEFQMFLEHAERPRERLAAYWMMKLIHIGTVVATQMFWYTAYISMREQDAGSVTFRSMLESFWMDDIIDLVKMSTKSFMQLYKLDPDCAKMAYDEWSSQNRDRYASYFILRDFLAEASRT